MDWFETLVKATKEYFSTNGLVILIVIVLTASITTILGYAVPAFGRFVRHLPQRIWEAVQMFREWCYWKHYHPKYTLINTSPAVISEISVTDKINDDPRYQIKIQMRLCIYNTDDINTLYVNFAQMGMSLRICSKTEKRAKYTLFYSCPTCKVIPNKEKVFILDFMTDQIDTKPKLANEAYCDNINIGIAQLVRIQRKLKGKPFDIKVDWSKIQVQGHSK